ncbi:hypothetical protein N7466_005821 [Penicillium verhagenii]|uniref:uncharacterized protein n=1 Tax=Penicillium verhagenii TaxID=1562060 RepID=UPI002545A73B|nr:uncharacterized protein N7466_005821 [Penicillium verhagenii]KAJ5930328.1 hypothetical protein N7466_005821 [Penicillium verhagenii]
MSDFLRRASDAFHNRQRQDSTGSNASMDETASPNAAKPPQQEPITQKTESVQPDSHPQDPVAGTATNAADHPMKHRRHWGWGFQSGQHPEAKQQPSQQQPSQPQKENNDWIFGS